MATCTTLVLDDGGLIIFLVADCIVSLAIFTAMWLFWELWIARKEKEADLIEVRKLSDDELISSSDLSEITNDNDIFLPDKLVWYKFYYQIWSIGDEALCHQHGNDGLLYIYFSRHLQVFTILLCLICAALLMPVYYFFGDEESTFFGQLTISNLPSDSEWLWVPTLAAPLILVIAVIIMENFRTKLVIEAPMEVEHAIIVQGTMLDKHDLLRYLSNLDLAKDVIDIQYVYDVEKAYKILSDRRRAARMELRYKDLAAEGRIDETVSHDGCLCCLVIEEPALQYWTQQKLELDQRFLEESQRVTRVSKVFIVWSQQVDVQRMLNTHKLTEVCRGPYRTSLSWNISKAPVHYDINWENYAESNTKWWFRAVLINIIVLILVFFFTTPIIIFLFIYQTFFGDDLDTSTSSSSTFWTEFGTVLILLAIEAVLPELVDLSCSLERHRTQANRNYWCIWKVFIYLLISELFMPAFGYTSLAALLRGYFSTDNLLSNWSCVFSAYRVAFMCKVLMSAALIGRTIELFNPWGVASYIYYYLEHKTKREYKQIFVRMRDRFNIGYNYAKLVAYSAIFISFGVICPVITLIGLTFVYIKYGVDKYLMIYFHRPCGSYGVSCHMAATTYLVFSCCLLQFFMLVYDAIYIGLGSPKTLVALIMVTFIVTIFYYDCWTDFVRWLFPERPYSDLLEREVNKDELVGIYLPPFLQQSQNSRPNIKVKRTAARQNTEKESFRTADSRGGTDYGSL
ncbi:hypothetical protein ACHWQZ_G005511 [Mnemiopsis leidyi]